MTTFAYTTGNPANLTGGANASMNDIQGPFTDLRTFLNGANLSDTQLVSPNNAIWRTLAEQPFTIAGGTASGTYWINGSLSNVGAPSLSGSTGNPAPVNLDPAEFVVAGKTAKLRLRVNLVAGGAPGVTLTFGVHPISSLSGTTSVAVTVGSGATGSGVALAPVANVYAQGVSTTFDFPAVGGYLFGVFVPGTTAANSLVSGRMQLSISHV